MIRKLCALGLVCGPIPLFIGTVIVPRVIRYFGESKKEKINFENIKDFKDLDYQAFIEIFNLAK